MMLYWHNKLLNLYLFRANHDGYMRQLKTMMGLGAAKYLVITLLTLLVNLSQGSLEPGVWDFELLKENNYKGAVKNVYAQTKVRINGTFFQYYI